MTTNKPDDNITNGEEDDKERKSSTTHRFIRLVPAVLTMIFGVLALSELLEESNGTLTQMAVYITGQIAEYQPHVISDRFSETLHNCNNTP
jgi:hypothetical protein